MEKGAQKGVLTHTLKSSLTAAPLYGYYSLRWTKHAHGCSVLMVRMMRVYTDQMDVWLQQGSGAAFAFLGRLITNKCFHLMFSDDTLDRTVSFPCWFTVSL